MSREIKFRSWIIAENKMIYGKRAMSVRMFTDSYGYLDNEVDVMQYTGLRDKNGVEIYEGDISQSKYFSPSEVKFVDGEFRFEDVTYADSMGYDDNEWEVIGNTFENPELLGDTQ